MLDQATFNAGIIAIKSAFRIDQFETDTLKTWRTLLQGANIGNDEYLEAIKIICTTSQSFFKNNNLAGMVISYIPAIRQRMKSEREHLKALAEARADKQLSGISEAEAEHNRQKIKYMIELQEAMKREPRREGETTADWLDRKHSIVEGKLVAFDEQFKGGQNGEKGKPN